MKYLVYFEDHLTNKCYRADFILIISAQVRFSHILLRLLWNNFPDYGCKNLLHCSNLALYLFFLRKNISIPVAMTTNPFLSNEYTKYQHEHHLLKYDF